MSVTPTPFDMEAPFGDRRAIVRRKIDGSGKTELVTATWGADPRFHGGELIRFKQAEKSSFPRNRGLIGLSEFHMKAGDRRFRVTLEDGNHFYYACEWTPPMADWPLSFQVITVPSNEEVARYQKRQGAIILRRQVAQWLDGTIADYELLVTPPDRLFRIEEIGSSASRQDALAL